MARKKIPHFKLYIDDFMNGTKDMSDEQVGIYIRMLCQIYDDGGATDFNPKKLKNVLHCRPTDAEKKVRQLIGLGKLFIDDNGRIHNGRADEEVEKRSLWLGRKSLAQQKRKARIMAQMAAELAANEARKCPEKPTKTNGDGAYATRDSRTSKDSSDMVAPSFHAKTGEDGASAPDVALCLKGSAPPSPHGMNATGPPRDPFAALNQRRAQRGQPPVERN
jgi:uncharacterized protein YdaU (DUF1376 family)